MNAEQTAVKPEDVQVGMWPEQTTGMHVGMPSGVKVTHKPTGIVVICETERSQHKNREKALQFIARALTRPAPTEAEVAAANWIRAWRNRFISERMNAYRNDPYETCRAKAEDDANDFEEAFRESMARRPELGVGNG